MELSSALSFLQLRYKREKTKFTRIKNCGFLQVHIYLLWITMLLHEKRGGYLALGLDWHNPREILAVPFQGKINVISLTYKYNGDISDLKSDIFKVFGGKKCICINHVSHVCLPFTEFNLGFILANYGMLWCMSQYTVDEKHALLLFFEEIRIFWLDFTMVAYRKIYFEA